MPLNLQVADPAGENRFVDCHPFPDGAVGGFGGDRYLILHFACRAVNDPMLVPNRRTWYQISGINPKLALFETPIASLFSHAVTLCIMVAAFTNRSLGDASSPWRMATRL